MTSSPLTLPVSPLRPVCSHIHSFAYVQFEDPQDAAVSGSPLSVLELLLKGRTSLTDHSLPQTAVQRMNGAYIGRHSIRPLIVEWSNVSPT